MPQRVEYFKGSKLVDALVGPKYTGKLAKEMPIKTRAEAAKLAQELLRLGFIHRSQRVQHAHSRRWELELYHGPFEEDGLFTWVYEGSKTKLYLMCAGMLFGALGLCMIQIWPLWLKIGVWWCSVTFLTTFGALCLVRLLLFVLMWIVGFRGICTCHAPRITLAPQPNCDAAVMRFTCRGAAPHDVDSGCFGVAAVATLWPHAHHPMPRRSLLPPPQPMSLPP